MTVRVFRTIEDFVKQSAPTPTQIGETDGTKLIDLGSLESVLLEKAQQAVANARATTGGTFSIKQSTIESHRFSNGLLYEIDENTKLAEIVFEYVVDFDLAFVPFNTQLFSRIGGTTALGSVLSGPTIASTTIPMDYPTFREVRLASQPALLPSMLDSATVHGGIYNVPSATVYVPEFRKYRFLGRAYISVRIQEKSKPEVELDRVESLSIQRSDNSPAKGTETEEKS